MVYCELKAVRWCRWMLLSALVGSAALSGCTKRGADLGFVTGRVTLDGKPLAGASVTYQPQHSGSISAAATDAEGQFEMLYSRSLKGAEVGQHMVKIRGPDADDHGPPPVRLPAIYNDRSELIREVKPGKNVHDFELTTPVRK